MVTDQESFHQLTVVAALILRDGRLLVCQRRKNDSFPLKWEFPGGKVHAGETPEQALRREIHEELGVHATVGRQVYRTRHRYREHPGELELIFFSATMPATGRMQNLAFEQIRWAQLPELPGFDFLPADLELVEKLARGELRPD